MTLKCSLDDGNTWDSGRKIMLDELGSFGYSCITSVNDSTIGVFMKVVRHRWFSNKYS